MRNCLAALMLFAVLPAMNVLATPVPPPYAILDIGPPRKGETPEAYRKEQIECLKFPHGYLGMAWFDPEVRKLPSVVPQKDARPWLAKHLQVTEMDGGRRLRLTFQAGERSEQAAILNALLRVYLRLETERRKSREESLQRVEDAVPQLKKLIATVTDAPQLARYQKDLESAPAHIAELRADIARSKQITVIRWAK